MKIGFFDSGIGGTTILEAVQKILPNEEYKYLADSSNCPYGEKSDTELQRITSNNVEILKKWGAKIIVVACNTATTRCISFLRQKYPNIHFIGTEPAVKLATNSSAQNILIMATPGTIKSERLKSLLQENQKTTQAIHLLPCPGLADAIEQNLTSNPNSITSQLNSLFHGLDFSPNSIDMVVLGCTHYSLIKPLIQPFFKNAKLIDGNLGVAKKVKNLIQNLQKSQN